MPANLTPQYKKAEEEYRRAQTPAEEVECLEKMLREIPKHKGTDHLQADLKTRLKQARAELADSKKKAKTGKSYKIPRQGAGQVVLIGAPNSGKSRILGELTSAHPRIEPFPFSTHEPQPGMMAWEDVVVQLVDTPPITADHMEGYLTGILRSADGLVVALDGGSDDAPEQTEAVFKKLRERKIAPGRETKFDDEDFAVVHLRTLIVATRADDPGRPDRVDFFRESTGLDLDVLPVELDRPDSVEVLRERIYRMLDVLRVYTKAPARKAEYKDPFTLPVGGTVEDLARLVHRDLAGTLKFAKVWGRNVHDSQSVGPNHVLEDGDLVELHS